MNYFKNTIQPKVCLNPKIKSITVTLEYDDGLKLSSSFVPKIKRLVKRKKNSLFKKMTSSPTKWFSQQIK